MGEGKNAPEERMAGRERYWEELTVDGKIERMRSMIKGLSEQLSYVLRDLDKLKSHTHQMDGKVVVPIHHDGPFTAIAGSTRGDKEWF